MNILTQLFDDTVTDDDLWDMATEIFAAMLIGMVLAVALYVVVTL
jgi:hypothetical protein